MMGCSETASNVFFSCPSRNRTTANEQRVCERQGPQPRGGSAAVNSGLHPLTRMTIDPAAQVEALSPMHATGVLMQAI